MNSTNGEQNSQPQISVDALEKSLKWQLWTLIGTGISYFLFACILSASTVQPLAASISIVPLIAYDVCKIVLCGMKSCKEEEIDKNEAIKDLVECALMLMYKFGVVAKIAVPSVSCLYLIVLPVLIFIVRIVVSMGIYKEINSLYAICRTSYRIFFLLITWTAVLKVEYYVTVDWGQTLWPYWIFFTELVFFSIGSIIAAFHVCMTRFGQNRFNFNYIVASIWLTYLFFGFTVSTFAFAYIFASHADSDISATISASYVFAMYLFVLVIFTLLAYQKIMDFGIYFYTSRHNGYAANNRSHEESTMRQIVHRRDMSSTDLGTTELVHRSMPGLLMRITNTLFKVIERGLLDNGMQKERKEDEIETEKEGPSVECESVKIDQSSNKEHKVWVTEEVSYEHIMDRKLKSERDAKKIIQEEKKVKENDEKTEQKGPLISQTCVICCDKPADAVLLPCGHGGLCFDCGKKLGRQCGDCYLCRKKFWQVLQLELMENNNTDFIRVVGMHSVFQLQLLPPHKRFILS